MKKETKDKREIRRLSRLIADIREAVGSRADDIDLRENEEIQKDLDSALDDLSSCRVSEHNQSGEIRRLKAQMEIVRLDRYGLMQAAMVTNKQCCCRPSFKGKPVKCNDGNGWCHVCKTKDALATIKYNNLKRLGKTK